MEKFNFKLLLGVLKKADVVYPHLPQIPAVKQARDEKHSVWDEGAPDTIILRDTGGNVRAYTYQGNDYFWMHWPNQVTFRFSGDEMDVLAYEETPQDEIFLTDLFWRNVVPFVLQAQGWEAIHASSVLTSKGVVAFCASSGTGKSTIAYGLSRRGYGLWGDDAVVFTTSPEGTLTFPLHFQLRLLGDTRDYYDIEQFSHSHAQKIPILVNRVNTDKPEGLRSIFLLERTDGEPELPGLRIEEMQGS